MSLEWIALNSVKGLGPVRIKKLIDAFGSPENVFSYSPAALAAKGLVPDACVAQMASKQLFADAQEQYDRAEKAGVVIITLASEKYPVYLKEIFAPPPVLFVKGDIAVFDSHALGVVGTRSPTVYGREAALSITRELIDAGIVIVSGLAAGIDAVAHQACIDHGGRTIAVLGCGIDIIYPAKNAALAEKIGSAGALVSEFPLGTRPEAFNFPRRNRIISGLSAGVLVVEGGEKSGSLITAHYALQQGRDVFAVPGPITSAASIGTFNLIRDGAIPARSGREIAAALTFIENPRLRTGVLGGLTIDAPLALLSDQERPVYDALSASPQRIDELSESTGRPVIELLEALLTLELKGLVRQISGQLFVRP
jgi:DNA processing protein